MKRILNLILVLIIMLLPCITAYADNGNVTYNGDAKKFIFSPGSEYSPTDLFDNFKGVMPGDSLTQAITVKNEADNKVKIKVFMRSLGAHEDSVDFLSQLHLRVQKDENNIMPYMFDAAADETAQLTDWVELGTLYSGGEVNLNVILDVPVELDNKYSSQIGYLDWEFMIEEFPIEEGDPKPPATGDDSNVVPWIAVMLAALVIVIILLLWRKKQPQDQDTNKK